MRQYHSSTHKPLYHPCELPPHDAKWNYLKDELKDQTNRTKKKCVTYVYTYQYFWSHALNLQTNNPSVYLLQKCMPVTSLHLCSRSADSQLVLQELLIQVWHKALSSKYHSQHTHYIILSSVTKLIKSYNGILLEMKEETMII